MVSQIFKLCSSRSEIMPSISKCNKIGSFQAINLMSRAMDLTLLSDGRSFPCWKGRQNTVLFEMTTPPINGAITGLDLIDCSPSRQLLNVVVDLGR